MTWKEPKRWVTAVAVILLVVYAAATAPCWKVGRDSALYLGLGQSLAEGHGYKWLDTPCERVPFGLPLLVAAIWRVAGPNYFLMNAVMGLLGLTTLWLIYRFMKEIAGPWWGLIVLVLTGFSYRMVQYSGQIMTDVPAMCGLWLGLFFLQRVVLRPGGSGVNAIGSVLGILTGSMIRLSTPFFIPLFVLAPWLRPRANGPGWLSRSLLSLLFASPVLAVVAWLSYRVPLAPGAVYKKTVASYMVPDSTERIWILFRGGWAKSILFLDAVWQSVTTQATGIDRLIDKATFPPAQTAGLVAILLLMLVLLGVGAWRIYRRDRGLSAIALLLYAVGIILTAWKANPRYILPISPLVFWYAAEGIQGIVQWIRCRNFRGDTSTGFPLSLPTTVILGSLLLLNLVKVGQEIRLARSADYYAVYGRGHWKPYMQATEWIKTHAPLDARLVSSDDRILSYLTGRLTREKVEECCVGDLLVLEPWEEKDAMHLGGKNTDTINSNRRLEVGWKLAKDGLAKEVFRFGFLTGFRVESLPDAATNTK